VKVPEKCQILAFAVAECVFGATGEFFLDEPQDSGEFDHFELEEKFIGAAELWPTSAARCAARCQA
jgi:hypothetical protein